MVISEQAEGPLETRGRMGFPLGLYMSCCQSWGKEEKEKRHFSPEQMARKGVTRDNF